MTALSFENDEPDELLLTEEVSAIIRVPVVGTLRRWRCQEPPVGPPSFPLNGFRVVYRKSKLREWLRQQEEIAGQAS